MFKMEITDREEAYYLRKILRRELRNNREGEHNIFSINSVPLRTRVIRDEILSRWIEDLSEEVKNG